MLLDTAVHVRLQFGFILQVVLLDALLAVGALLPHIARSLVAANVYIFTGEQCHHLVKHILPELEGALLACAGNLLRHAPVGPCLVVALLALAAEPRICAQCAQRVTGDLNLGHYGDEALLCILHNLLYLLLCVVAAIGDAVESLVVACRGLLAQASNLGEQRVFLYLYAPALVLGQVPVETVHLVHGKDVQHLLYCLNVPEVA